MAWFMFRDSGSYQYRGKKCDGFENKMSPKINLSWGLDAFDQSNLPKTKPYAQPTPSKQKKIPSGLYKKDEEEELQKIMKDYQSRKINESQDLRVMNLDDLSDNPQQRMNTQQSSDRIRFLENSLLPISRRDTVGAILNHEKALQTDLTESRVSRRSQSGNKKNQSSFVFGDGMYNSFMDHPQKSKDFHQRMLEMYEYEDKNKGRKVSQVM